jgi:hypothetical protein
MDLGAWLRDLDLEEYEAAFRQNHIDATVLPSLAAEDLKDLGIGSIGHRRKLLDAIALLRAETTAKAPTPEAPSAAPKPTQDTAERRQVTVMFSDLVGSTALSGRMDPEDLREVISTYQKCVAETVRRFGGFVAKYLGDGVLAVPNISAGSSVASRTWARRHVFDSGRCTIDFTLQALPSDFRNACGF